MVQRDAKGADTLLSRHGRFNVCVAMGVPFLLVPAEFLRGFPFGIGGKPKGNQPGGMGATTFEGRPVGDRQVNEAKPGPFGCSECERRGAAVQPPRPVQRRSSL